MNTSEIKKICDDCLKLKEKIYENKIYLKATKEQEDTFYRVIDSFISRLKYHCEIYSNMDYVKDTLKTVNELEKTNDRVHTTFLFDKMKNNLIYVYMKYQNNKNNKINFVAAVEPTIFYPIRIIAEKLYRNLLKESHDQSLDNFLKSKKIN